MAVSRRVMHPAVRIVERTEQLWQDDRNIASERARLIGARSGPMCREASAALVQRLIETGHLAGTVYADFPAALTDEHATV